MGVHKVKNRNIRNEQANGWKKIYNLTKGTEIAFRDSKNKLHKGVIVKVHSASYDIVKFDKNNGEYSRSLNVTMDKFYGSHSMKKV